MCTNVKSTPESSLRSHFPCIHNVSKLPGPGIIAVRYRRKRPLWYDYHTPSHCIFHLMWRNAALRPKLRGHLSTNLCCSTTHKFLPRKTHTILAALRKLWLTHFHIVVSPFQLFHLMLTKLAVELLAVPHYWKPWTGRVVIDVYKLQYWMTVKLFSAIWMLILLGVVYTLSGLPLRSTIDIFNCTSRIKF